MTASVFQREYDDVRVTDVQLDDESLVVRIAWASAYLVVLDDDGIPESVLREGQGGVDWRLPVPELGEQERSLLLAMRSSAGSLTETGALVDGHDVLVSRHLHSDNGVVIQAC
jgi:hypothetical protein